MTRIEKIKELHDLIKENPFWINFDEIYLNGLLDLYRKLSWEIYDPESWHKRDDPYYVVLDKITHDFNAMLSNICWRLNEDKPIENKGDIICVLQTYLTNVHGLFDKEREETVIGYTYSNGLKKYMCLFDETSQKYTAYNCIKTKNVEALERKLNNSSYVNKTWQSQCLSDIKENKQFIGDNWYIEDYENL